MTKDRWYSLRMLRPDARVRTLAEVTPALLGSIGVRDALIDLDDTLVASGGDDLAVGAKEMVSGLFAAGIRLAIVSNGTPDRVLRAAQALGIGGIPLAGKPFGRAFERALALLPGAQPTTTAMIGDQLFTDVLGARAAGMKTVLVDPLSPGKLPHTRLARVVERMILEER